ncbi:MAG: ABC transporter ATP-binding protein [Saccharolobus sp.]
MSIKVIQLTKYYGKNKAIENVEFTVNNGELVGFVGVNGAGKTTTIKICAGIIKPSKGRVFIDSIDILENKDKASENIGWVPESPTFEQDVKVKDYLKYLAGYHKLSTNEIHKKVKELLEVTNLAQYSDYKIRDLSQGNKKRFALAASLISDPYNLLFDEVMNGLDPQGILFFREVALKLKKEGRAILFSSHILSEVEAIADRVIFIHRGRIIADKSIDEIRNQISRKTVKISIKNADEKLISLLKEYGEVSNYNNKVFIINNFNGDTSELNEKLVKNNYKVEELVSQIKPLESYFFELIGGESK